MSNHQTMAIANIYSQMLEEKTKKLDAVGTADADIDNDGDVDSSDKFLHARRKAIKKSIKKEDTESVDEARQLKDPKKETMVVDTKGKTMVIDKSKQDAYLAKGWKLAESIEVDDEESESEVDDPKAKKKEPKKSTGKQDPAAANAPSQDDRAAAADAPVVDPTPVLKKDKKDDKEVKEGTEALDENVTKSMGWNSSEKSLDQLTKAFKQGSNLHKTVKVSVKGADGEFRKMETHLAKAASAFASLKMKINGQNEGFDWDAITEMNDEALDNYIDTLEESQLDDFESQMNSFISESDDNPRASADEYNKDQQGFKDRHRVNVIDRPDADKPKAADATKASPKRPGDKDVGDKKKVTLKRLKDIRK